MKIIIIGGSGFVSGTLAKEALAAGHEVWTVTRGQQKLVDGVTPVIVDRNNRGDFAEKIAGLNVEWDLLVDCIGYVPDEVKQDIAVFKDRARHFVFISTDFTIDPKHRTYPQDEEATGYAAFRVYGGDKRLCELELINGDTGDMKWTILRPCHVYGPGSPLGCLPQHSRDKELIEKLKAGEALKLVGGGHFLQQPILASDLARLILSCPGNAWCHEQVYMAAGPEIAESAEYFHIIARHLGVEAKIIETPVDEYLAAHPESAPFLVHRIYTLEKMRRHGLAVPSTSLADGLAQHTDWLLDNPMQ